MTRDEKGRFPKGVSGNPHGRKPRAVEKDYLELFKAAVSTDDWKEIVQKAVIDAKRGDGVARKFIADYLVGPPIQRNEVTGADGAALKIIVEYANDTAEIA